MAVAAKLTLKLIKVAINVPVTIVTKKAVEKAWLAARPEDPPRRAKDADVSWADAITWGAISAIGLVISDLVARRGSEAVYRAVVGLEPPAAASSSPKKLKELEAQKKLSKRKL